MLHAFTYAADDILMVDQDGKNSLTVWSALNIQYFLYVAYFRVYMPVKSS